MKIYFARHGQYDNPDKVVPYRLPGFPLTDLGREQARLQADKLLNSNLRDIFTSPIERCLETATIIGQTLKLHPNEKEVLTETGTPLQGMTKVALNDLSPNYPYDVPSHINGGGETPEEIFARIKQFVDGLKRMSGNSSHLVVSHGDPIHIYLTAILTGKVPSLDAEYFHSQVRYIPMGGLVMLDYRQKGVPKYSKII